MAWNLLPTEVMYLLRWNAIIVSNQVCIHAHLGGWDISAESMQTNRGQVFSQEGG
jgi:hypothetical protein